MAEQVIQKKWKRKIGFVSEFNIDARWVLYAEGDPRPQGSLRIVSFPNLLPGHLMCFCSIVIKRTPKTEEELISTIVNHDISEEELELYSIDEHIETWDLTESAPSFKLEKTYGVKIFN